MGKKVCWISLTQECNLRCSWCYAREQGYQSIQMDRTLLFELIDFCKEADVFKIVFLGGEPTLYPFLTEAISYAKRQNIRTEITTNGLMLKDNEFLMSLVDSGLDSVMLSIKGYDQKSFLHTTGFDGYSDVIRAIDNLNRAKIKFGVSFVLTDEFLDGIEHAISDMQAHNVPLIVFSLAKEYSSTREARDFSRRNSPYVLLPRLYEKMKGIEDKLTCTKWLIELCFGLDFKGEMAGFLEKHAHYSCKCNVSDGIIFDFKGNLLACNTMPNSTFGAFKKDFSSYNEYKAYIKRNDYE